MPPIWLEMSQFMQEEMLHALSFYKIPIGRRRTSEKLSSKLKGINNCNDLPHKIIAFQDVHLFKNNATKFIYNSL